jgi:hypothetical protein
VELNPSATMQPKTEAHRSFQEPPRVLMFSSLRKCACVPQIDRFGL